MPSPRFNATSGGVIYHKVAAPSPSSAITAKSAYLQGPADTLVLGGHTATSFGGAFRKGPIDTFLVVYQQNDTLTGPQCEEALCTDACANATATPPIQTLGPTTGPVYIAPESQPMPTWLYAVFGIAGAAVLVAILAIAFFIWRCQRARKQLDLHDSELQNRALERTRQAEQRMNEARAAGYTDPFEVQELDALPAYGADGSAPPEYVAY